jgi:transcription-repair coupling factor (superfamily II helicase)
MFHKILDEAIAELKQTEFEELFKDTDGEYSFVKDCQLETDLEVLLPNDYVSNIQERLSLYKELENAENETMLLEFSKNLEDRFGPIPPQTEELINTLRLRWLGKKIGFEKIILKSNRLSGVFTGDQDSGYFQTEAFGKVLDFIKNHPTASTMKEIKGKLTIRFDGVRSVKQAIETLEQLT